MLKLYGFTWGLVYVYVIADSREEALEKVRSHYSVAREDYPNTEFSHDPSEEDCSLEGMITHHGYD